VPVAGLGVPNAAAAAAVVVVAAPAAVVGTPVWLLLELDLLLLQAARTVAPASTAATAIRRDFLMTVNYVLPLSRTAS
jgi:hypothetical protein